MRRRLPEPLLELGRLRPAAVHDDDAARPSRASARDVARRSPASCGRCDDLAAELMTTSRARRAHGQPPGSSSVSLSSRPSIRFIDWIAWPAPPLIRLSVDREARDDARAVARPRRPSCEADLGVVRAR